MALIEFKDYPNTSTPLNAENLNNNFNEVNNIAESGSNDNGHYIKFSDGTLIQHTIFTVAPNNQSYDIYFPTPFIDDNYVITPMFMYMNSIAVISTFSSKYNNWIRIHNTFLDTANREWIFGENWAHRQTIGVIAIGKWK